MNRPLHRGGFPPIDPATIGKTMRDGRAYKRAYVRIDPPFPWLRILVAWSCGAVATFTVAYFAAELARAVV